MNARVRSLVVTNWPIKLTSLVLAAVLWAVVAAEEPTTQLVPVRLILELPEGRGLTRPLPPVRALVSGPARELVKLYANPPVITAVIPDTVSGSSYWLDLAPADLKLARQANLKAEDVQPRRLEVRLDAVSHRLVPVVSRVSIKPDTGFAVVGGVTLAPSSLLVRGPAAVLAQLDSVSTIPLEITAVRGPIRRSVPLDTGSLGLAQPARREVEISAQIEAVSERVLLDLPVQVRSEHGAWTAEPATVLVTVRGPATRVAQLQRDSVAVVALPTSPARRQTVRLNLLVPAGLEARAVPDTVRLLRAGDG